MITTLDIKDYESHKDTLLEFSSGLNVFIGETDRGKSGVFRSFYWVKENPGGSSMFPLYWDSKQTDVIAELDNGYSICRSKGKSVNEYIIYDNSGEEEWRSNAGVGAPKEVRDLLCMGDINFQSQIDRPFLMFESAGERGRILNKIAGLDKIDSCIKNASQDVRRIGTSRKLVKKDIAILEKELLQFDNLPRINEVLSEMEELESEIQQTEKLITTVESLLVEKVRLEKALEKEYVLKAISEKVVKCSSIEESIKTYKDILGRARALKLRSKELKDKYNKKDLLAAISLKVDELEKINIIYYKLESKYDKVNELQIIRSACINDIKSVEREIEQLKEKLPNVCPTCGELLK